jgi:hypothetical protein
VQAPGIVPQLRKVPVRESATRSSVTGIHSVTHHFNVRRRLTHITRRSPPPSIGLRLTSRDRFLQFFELLIQIRELPVKLPEGFKQVRRLRGAPGA